MKELSIEEKAKAYDEAVINGSRLWECGEITRGNYEYIFPELKESEDEKIRKVLLNDFKNNCSEYYCEGVNRDMIIAWLEKQGDKEENLKERNICETCDEQASCVNPCPMKLVEEQKPADKVEPKFKVGDWTVSNLDKKARQISEVHFDEYNSYYVVDGKSVNLEEYDRLHHLWAIQDAKDGDVLHCWIDGDEFVLIYKGIKDGYITTYCHLYQKLESFSEEPTTMFCKTIQGHFTPATKEQRDQLEKEMADAGYTFDFEKKELRKIEQKFAEWGEEDENRFNNLIFLVECSDENEPTKKGFIDFINRLKPTSHQRHWKPSEEQIYWLKWATSRMSDTEKANEAEAVLEELLEQLKKLREE